MNIRVNSNGSQIVDGDTFQISNGSETLRFDRGFDYAYAIPGMTRVVQGAGDIHGV